MKKYSKYCHTVLATSIALALSLNVAAQQETPDDEEIERLEVRHQKQPYRGDVPLKSIPQAVSIVSGELLRDAGIVDFQSALDFTSGVVRQNNFGGLWDSFAIRGFSGDENLPSGYLINGFSAGRGYSGQRDTSNIQSIEVLKGPGSALYGRSEPGGTINIITKKPQFVEEGYIQASAGNYQTYRLEGDYTNEISSNVAFRLNGSYEDAGSFRDTVETKKISLTPSILFLLSDDTSLSYELEIIDQENPFDRGVVVIDDNFGEIPPERFLGEPGDGPMKVEAMGHQLVLQHKLNEDWDILAGIGYRDSSFEGISSEANLTFSSNPGIREEGTLSRFRRSRDYDSTDLSARLEFSGTFDAGSLTHHMLVGFDAYDYSLDTLQSRFRMRSPDPVYSINLFNPVYGQPLPEMAPLQDRTEEQQSYGVYFQDQIDLSEQWKLLVGLRFDNFEQDVTNNFSGSTVSQDQTATSPRLGLVFEVNENLTLYTSYAEGFRPNSGAAFDGTPFDPEDSESYEVGMKMSTPDESLNGTLAIYRAEKSNILTADPVNGGSAALGAAESQGIELDLTALLSESTTLSLAYAYTDAETSNDVINADWGVEILAGSQLINVAENTANVTLRHYMEVSGKEANIGVSLNYVGDRLGETINPDYNLPSYTLVRVFGSISINERFKLMFDIDNLLDEEYYASSYSQFWTMPGSPLNYRASVRYQF